MPSKSVFISKDMVGRTLANTPTLGKKILEPLKSFAEEHNVPLNILEAVQILDNKAEVHLHEHDLWHCLEGEVEFICGGELVEPQVRKKSDGTLDENELRAQEVKGGTIIALCPGDWLWIPAGEPHQHRASGLARLAIIKIPKC